MDQIAGVSSLPLNHRETTKSNATSQSSKSFGHMLGEALEQVNDSQLKANQETQKLINGKETDLHNVMIASKKASISLSTAVEIRDKAINAYQSIMRMQI